MATARTDAAAAKPLDVATIVLKSPKVTGMATPQYKFEQNNGTVKPVKQETPTPIYRIALPRHILPGAEKPFSATV